MEEVLQALASFFVYAVVAVFAQNAVFTRALGVSRVVKLVDDGTVDTVMFGSLLCAVQLISAPLGYFASGWISQLSYRDYIRPLVFLGCAAVAFFVVLLFSVVIFRVDGARRAVAVLPMPRSTPAFGHIAISSVQNFNFAQTLGFALGSGIGYVLAVVVVMGGEKRLESEKIPAMFRGLPITLLYIGILALAIYGFTGHMAAF
ncbi:MAG: Rnf-Nqr domain containing protein [Ruthenibacterium sp.]